MPMWAWIALGVGVALLLAAAGYGALLGWRTMRDRYVLRLVGRFESIEATRVALVDAMHRLSEETAEQIEVFASEPDSVDRRALAEIANRSLLLVEELDTLSVPGVLVTTADALADAAFALAREAGRVREDQTGEEVLEALAEMDLGVVTAYADRAREAVEGRCEEYGLDNAAVYGGGLYL